MRTGEADGTGRPGVRTPSSSTRPAGPAVPAGLSAVRHAPLLDMIVTDALDPAYADAAARRRNRPPRARSATIVLLLVGGIVVGLTVGRERVEAPAAEQARTALIGDARQRTAVVEELSAQIEQLRQDTSQLQASVLASTQEGRAVTQQRADLSAAAGQTVVTGPGVAVTVDDAPDTAAGRGSAEQRPDGTVAIGRVTDRNLQDVVNALWAAGAEAVSVGGVRLSPTTAIRTAGVTVLADYRPLTAPYVLFAVGDPAALDQRFRTTGAGILTRLGQQDSPVRVTRRTDLQLPAAAGTDSRVATPLPSNRTPGAPS